ncbi:MAG: ABC transporter ATP-binding protein [Verrucomicrobiales bacterium]|nr:ABC transporter ATP-binding protein [Verrucomicrobiales bacterium]
MLSVSGISKRFDRRKAPAVDEVSFEVPRGSICGLLGHNGAGKSTALGVILGMVYPDSGEVSIDGTVVQQEREKAIRKVGAIFETPSFYEYLSGLHNLKILSAHSGGVSAGWMQEMIEWVGLEKRIHDQVGTYSHGMRQRLALAQALLPKPELLILDEPTDGLDPEGIVEFRTQLLELRERLGLTVLLSSHLLSEVEQVCDEVVILQGGKKVYDGGVRDFGGTERSFRIEVDPGGDLPGAWKSIGGNFSGDECVYSGSRKASELLASLLEAGIQVNHFAEQKDSLEALYLRVSSTRGEKGGDA